jgi:uncharacterized membrane protein YfcA
LWARRSFHIPDSNLSKRCVYFSIVQIVRPLPVIWIAIINTVTVTKLLTLVVVSLLSSIVSVVTGSTSLITVPVMIAMGMDPRVAIATNMLALTFMSLGGSVPFVRRSSISGPLLPLSILLTLLGSAAGALVVLTVPIERLRLCIALAMIAAAVFTLARRDFGNWR